MKYVLAVLGFLVLGAGAAVLLAELRAVWQINDRVSAFENGDGFAAQLRSQRLVSTLDRGDGQKINDMVKDRLAHTPFDPVLLSLKAINLAPSDLALSDLTARARLLDQARVIAPRDPRVRALRRVAHARLQNLMLAEPQRAE